MRSLTNNYRIRIVDPPKIAYTLRDRSSPPISYADWTMVNPYKGRNNTYTRMATHPKSPSTRGRTRSTSVVDHKMDRPSPRPPYGPTSFPSPRTAMSMWPHQVHTNAPATERRSGTRTNKSCYRRPYEPSTAMSRETWSTARIVVPTMAARINRNNMS